MWSMFAAPLFLSANLAAMPVEVMAIVQNAEVIAIDQDPLGNQARMMSDSSRGFERLQAREVNCKIAHALVLPLSVPALSHQLL
jgi:alpha-galactosidase